MTGFDPKALQKITYGLFVITCSYDGRDNGMICNTVTQVASDPMRIAVSINKANFSHDMIKNAGTMNVCMLTEEAPFEVFTRFGFQSGKDADKFAGEQVFRSANGAPLLTKYINSFMSLKVVDYSDLGSHGLFICEPTDSAVMSDKPSMSYAYYHANVKPKRPAPAADSGEKKVKGYICNICGYIYEGETLPEDFICPLCKHPASDFSPIE